MQEAVAADRLDEVFGVLDAVGKAHPAEPHWFLPAIGVEPMRQGRGYGSALLQRSLEAVDADHWVAYLEASNPRNVPLICAVSMRRKFAILTTDNDFAGFARALGFELHAPR